MERETDTEPRLDTVHELDAATVEVLVGYLQEQSQRVDHLLGGVLGVAVTLNREGCPTTAGASSQAVVDVDELQFGIGTGPCLHVLRGGDPLYVADLAADHRWQDYGPRAAALGARSCVSMPVQLRERRAAVLKVYSAEVDGISSEQRSVIRQVALELTGGMAVADLLVRQSTRLGDRTAAMEHRHVIDMAVGMLMEKAGVGSEDAFGLLRRQSQYEGVKVRAVARRMVGVDADTSGVPWTEGSEQLGAVPSDASTATSTDVATDTEQGEPGPVSSGDRGAIVPG